MSSVVRALQRQCISQVKFLHWHHEKLELYHLGYHYNQPQLPPSFSPQPTTPNHPPTPKYLFPWIQSDKQLNESVDFEVTGIKERQDIKGI